jgi:uncharacterized protein
MIKLLPALFLFLFMVLIMAIVPPRTSVALHSSDNPNKATAVQQPGIKQYWMVLLKEGPNQSLSRVQTGGILAAHSRNVQHLTNNGKMLAAGPFNDESTALKGVYILNCKDSLEAACLLQSDTAIATGMYSYELKSWKTTKGDLFQ